MSRRTLRLTEISQFRLQDSHPLWFAFPHNSTIIKFCNSNVNTGLVPFRSPLLRESLLLSFPTGTKMFQFPAYTFHYWILALQASGFPHSEISGSLPTYGSPKHIAVRRVLHRLQLPRHSPCALIFLTFYSIIHFSKTFFINLVFKIERFLGLSKLNRTEYIFFVIGF